MNTETKRYIYFILLIGIMLVIWIFYIRIGISGFSRISAVTIFSSVIEGMSALLSVSIAVFIFRIQSLENRNQQLEESTLSFIYQITEFTYPKWIPSVEEDIRSGALTKQYYEFMIARLKPGKSGYNTKVKVYANDRDIQQKRLEETLNLHDRTKQTIQRIRNGVFSSVFFLFLPILFSFYMLIVSDALDVIADFFAASITVLIAVLGIAMLIMTVLESTVAND